MKFTDLLSIDGTRKRAEDGALLVDARAARTGIQTYSGFEVGKPEMATVRVFRSADEVFSVDSLKSFAHRPVTNNHPSEMVTSDNWRKTAVGQTSDEVTAEKIYVRVPLMVSDAAAIADIESGKRELSAGYVCDLDWTGGTTQAGEQFDASQKNIRVNHIAIVDRGRAGPECRIGDSAEPWGPSPINDEGNPLMNTKIMTVDGIPILVTDQAEAMITKLQGQLSTATAALTAKDAEHNTALAAKDTKIGELTAELKTIKDAAPKPGDLDKMVADRASLVDVASKLVKDFKPAGLTDADIRKAVVEAKYGVEAVKDANADMIAGMFAVAAKDATNAADPFRAALTGDRQFQPTQVKDNGQDAYVKRLTDGWKGTPPVAN